MAILDFGTANLAALAAGQTVAQTDRAYLTAKIGAFKTLLTSPRQAKAGTKAATDLLPDKIDAADRICERQLDRLMNAIRPAMRISTARIKSHASSWTPAAVRELHPRRRLRPPHRIRKSIQ
jgi:hypothetical protein